MLVTFKGKKYEIDDDSELVIKECNIFNNIIYSYNVTSYSRDNPACVEYKIGEWTVPKVAYSKLFCYKINTPRLCDKNYFLAEAKGIGEYIPSNYIALLADNITEECIQNYWLNYKEYELTYYRPSHAIAANQIKLIESIK